MPRLLRLPIVWIAAPTLLALVWWAAYAALKPVPTVLDLPPSDAVVVERYRDLATFDAFKVAAGFPEGVALEHLGSQLNVPSLAGVDRHRPVHLIRMPSFGPLDVGLVVMPTADLGAFRAQFNDLSAISEGRVRHAQQLETYGDQWLALSLDRDVVRRLGEGGPACADRDEDVAYAVRVPALAQMALAQPGLPPWRGWLRELGMTVDKPVITGRTPDGVPIASFEGADRVQRIEAGWALARAWLWAGTEGAPGRARFELEARAPDLKARLSSAAASTGLVPQAAPEAGAWIRVAPNAAPALMASAWHLGLAFEGTAPAWQAPSAQPRELGVSIAWVPGLQAGSTTVLMAQGANDGELVLGEGPWSGRQNAKEARVDGLLLAAAGASASRDLDRLRGHVQTEGGEPTALAAPSAASEQGVLLAIFGLKAEAAQALLGEAIAPGGLFHVLAGGDLEGAVFAEGSTLVVTIAPSSR